jgi:hypothetical protein
MDMSNNISHRFDYLLNKIRESDFSLDPFKHVEIRNFFSKEDFQEITTAKEISTSGSNDPALIDHLLETGYRIINFPGCVTEADRYIQWHASKHSDATANRHDTCEGFGMVLRLIEPKTNILVSLNEFLKSDVWNACLAEKFDLDLEFCTRDCGLQKYLDGYEISPHPDVTRKALTYMVNINNGQHSESRTIHTHFLKMKPEWAYITEYWKGNPRSNRCWVPWDWCETIKRQTDNNSIVIFAPGPSTMHAVHADYDHLEIQRTQLYGNLWLNKVEVDIEPVWQDHLVGGRAGVQARQEKPSLAKRIINRVSKKLSRRSPEQESKTHAKLNHPKY